jgi:hypothetical protein
LRRTTPSPRSVVREGPRRTSKEVLSVPIVNGQQSRPTTSCFKSCCRVVPPSCFLKCSCRHVGDFRCKVDASRQLYDNIDLTKSYPNSINKYISSLLVCLDVGFHLLANACKRLLQTLHLRRHLDVYLKNLWGERTYQIDQTDRRIAFWDVKMVANG